MATMGSPTGVHPQSNEDTLSPDATANNTGIATDSLPARSSSNVGVPPKSIPPPPSPSDLEGRLPTIGSDRVSCLRDSPHTFASTYEQWNNTTNYTTTSDDEEEEEEDDEEEQGDDGSSADMSHHHHPHNLFHNHHPPSRLTARKLFDSDDDDCSSLSVDTHEFGKMQPPASGRLHRTADPRDVDSADSPPSPPRRVKTQEDASAATTTNKPTPTGATTTTATTTTTQLEQDVRAKAMGRAPTASGGSGGATVVARKRAPVAVRDTKKEQDFVLRQRQRVAERSNKFTTTSKQTNGTAAASAVAARSPMTSNPRSIAEMEAASKKRASARPAVMTRRAVPGQVVSSGSGGTTNNGASTSLSQHVAVRQHRGSTSVGAVSSTHDRAALKQTSDGQEGPDGPMLASKKASYPEEFKEEFKPPVAGKKAPPPPSPLEAAMAARQSSRPFTVAAPQTLSSAQDRAATKGLRSTNNGQAEEDQEEGPKLAPHPTSSKQSRPASTLQEALRTRQASQVPMPESVHRASDRLSAKILQEDEEELSNEDQGPQLARATSRKKTPPKPTHSSHVRPFPATQSVSSALDRAAAKMAKHEGRSSTTEFAEDDVTTVSTSRKSPPSNLQAAMQARQASRSSGVPMPAAVSRALDRAGAKMEDAEASPSDEEDNGPQIVGPKQYTQAPPSDLLSAMQSRESSRSSAVPMPTAISRAMDRAGAKMEDIDEGPQLDASTSRSRALPSGLASAMQAREASRSSNFAIPESVSRAMDRAGAKMGDDQDNDRGPQLAAARARVPSDPDATSDGFYLDEKVAARRTRAASATTHDNNGSAKPKATPGAHTSIETPMVDKKLSEYAIEEVEDEGPALAAPRAIEERERFGPSMATIQDMSESEHLNDDEAVSQYPGHNDFTIVPAVYAGEDDLERGQEDDEIIEDIQEGLIVTEQQAGAYAVQGIDATDEDDLYHEGFDPTTNALIETEATVVVESPPSAPVLVASTLDVAPLQAELFDQPVFQGDIYEEADLEDDPKFRRRLRIMQGVIFCSSLFGLAFVIISIVAGLDSSGLPPEPTITGWRSVGNAVFGPNTEESQIFFASSAAISASGTRIVVSAPGTDQDDNFNTGEVSIWDEAVLEFGNSTWELKASLPGPGPSDTITSPVTMASTGDRIAVGYPFSLGGKVQVFEESNGWIQTESLTLGPNATTAASWFGFAVDMSDQGEFLAIGAPLDSLSGSVSVFRRTSDGSWLPLGDPILAQGPAELFGWSVSLTVTSTLRVAVGAPSHDTETGLVRVYDWVDSAWTQVGATLTGEEVLSRFGETCALSEDGTVLAIGIRGSPFETGKVQIFRQIGDDWVADEQVIEGSEPGGGFGAALSITPDGNTVAVGGPSNNAFGEGSGHIQVWSYNGNSWNQQGSSIGGDINAAYGSTVALTPDGQRVVGGAPPAPFDGSIPENGYFRVYDREDSTVN